MGWSMFVAGIVLQIIPHFRQDGWHALCEPLGSAVKFGRLAEGSVDLYPRLAPTSEWDVAAGHAVVTAAGGRVTDPDGGILRFGEGHAAGFIVPGFIAWGDPSAAESH